MQIAVALKHYSIGASVFVRNLVVDTLTRRCWYVTKVVLNCRLVSLTLTALIDRWMYGYWTLVPLNFLKFNFLSSGGDFYGTHPWHWYFSQGFPVMVFSFLPLTVYGIWISKRWYYAGLIGWVLGVYSLLGHKEFRYALKVGGVVQFRVEMSNDFVFHA